MAEDSARLLGLLFMLALAAAMIVAAGWGLRTTLRRAREYVAGTRAPGDYWPLAIVVCIVAPSLAAFAGGLVGLGVGIAVAPKQPYAEGAGIAAVLLGLVAAVTAAAPCGILTAGLLIIRPLVRKRRAEKNRG